MEQIRGERVSLRPIEPRDREPLKAIRDEPEVIRFWGRQTPEWPGDDETVEEWVVELEGELIGFVQFFEEPDEDYRYADVDILLATRFHGQGLGTDTMRAVMAYLTGVRGHHRLTLATWPHNARAIHLYEKLGFRQIGITRLSERRDDGEWHDELLMEYVVEPPGGAERPAAAR
jgi:aminoglycoside 6'-N-acetyltransferase